jgi:hypothetical protein
MLYIKTKISLLNIKLMNFDCSKIIKEIYFLDFIKINNNLKNFQRFEISVSFPISIDMINEYHIHIAKEIKSNIYRLILKNFSNRIFLDYSECDGDLLKINNTKLTDFIQKISLYNTHNWVCNIQITSLLQDSRFYSFSASSINYSSMIYPVGKMLKNNIYVDPYKRWDDNTIQMFDSIDVCVKNFTTRVVSEATFNPKIVIGFELAYEIKNPSMVHIMVSKNCQNYMLYTQDQRDQKIDIILNG